MRDSEEDITIVTPTPTTPVGTTTQSKKRNATFPPSGDVPKLIADLPTTLKGKLLNDKNRTALIEAESPENIEAALNTARITGSEIATLLEVLKIKNTVKKGAGRTYKENLIKILNAEANQGWVSKLFSDSPTNKNTKQIEVSDPVLKSVPNGDGKRTKIETSLKNNDVDLSVVVQYVTSALDESPGDLSAAVEGVQEVLTDLDDASASALVSALVAAKRISLNSKGKKKKSDDDSHTTMTKLNESDRAVSYDLSSSSSSDSSDDDDVGSGDDIPYAVIRDGKLERLDGGIATIPETISWNPALLEVTPLVGSIFDKRRNEIVNTLYFSLGRDTQIPMISVKWNRKDLIDDQTKRLLYIAQKQLERLVMDMIKAGESIMNRAGQKMDIPISKKQREILVEERKMVKELRAEVRARRFGKGFNKFGKKKPSSSTENKTCYNCKELGHVQKNCPKKKN